jgi:hypothetical protein
MIASNSIGGQPAERGLASATVVGAFDPGDDRDPAQHLVLLLQQTISATQLPQLRGLTGRAAGLGTVVDVGLAHPLRQGHRVHTEIGGDLLDGHTVVAVAGDPHDIVAELTGIRPCHSDILSACPPWASDLRCHLFVQQTRVFVLIRACLRG